MKRGKNLALPNLMNLGKQLNLSITRLKIPNSQARRTYSEHNLHYKNKL